MRRFSILSLMGLILAFAVAFAALRGANSWWAGGLVLCTLGLLGYSILASVHGEGRSRAAWLGFFVLCGGYFLACRTLPDEETKSLPTSQLLQYVQDQVVSAIPYTVTFTASLPGGGPPAAFTPTINYPPAAPGAPAPVLTTVNVTGPPPQAASTASFVVAGNSALPVTTWGRLLPGAADFAAFKSVGQCLFALLFGWIGAGISRRMWSRQAERSMAS